MPDPIPADYHCHVLTGEDFSVISGANVGDPLLSVEELCAGDVYRLDPRAQAIQLAISDNDSAAGRVLAPGTSAQSVADGSELGAAGDRLGLTARLTFLAPEGHKVDLLLLELSGANGSRIAALPLEPMEPGHGHTLIGIDEAPGAQKLADITSMAFGRGTHITLADGRQSLIEALEPGQKILTRDHGAQPLRQVIKRTVRAVGPYAPVIIPNETLGNAGDLILSQHQRLFIYQRGDDRLTATAEMLVKAAYLVDDEKIYIRPGGYTDFFTLIFDHHEVIYAECIPVESLEVNQATRPALPEDIAREVGQSLPELNHRPHFGTEADKDAARAARDRLLKDRNSRS